ncbi:MAG: hypothetical protein JW884_06345 [Deltaproteobacteria bacterium]|nr:hypothetical protein [Deltaproteobacteria bacterium]
MRNKAYRIENDWEGSCGGEDARSGWPACIGWPFLRLMALVFLWVVCLWGC